MKLNRVECDTCQHFTDLVQEDPNNMMSKQIAPAKCGLGKRVMFRMPAYFGFYEGGWIRYCNDFKLKETAK